MESDFGIEGFASDLEGFTCVLKQRYQDFVVNEIDSQNRVVHLTNLDPVEKQKEDAAQEATNDKKSEQSEIELWSTEIGENLKDLSAGKRQEVVVIPCEDLDKVKRTQIHQAIRERFPNLQSATNKQVINVTRSVGGRQESRKRRHWPTDQGDYVRFVLYKENKDSQFALALISRLLGVKSNGIGLAGTKDRRGVTTQLATVYRIQPDKLAALNPQLRGIKVGNFEYCENQLYLGDSKGNRFTVVMRNIQADRSIVETAVRKWSERGFINFYGTQRFGTTAVATHTIGKAILKKQWAEAVDLLLKPRDNAPEDMAECYKIWASTKDAGKAFASIPSRRRSTCIEGDLLVGLKKHGLNDFSNAFKNVARNSRMLYVHSLQSYIWNKLISIRVAKYGQQMLVGDSMFKAEDENNVNLLKEDELETADPFKLLVPLPSSNAVLENEEMSRWFDEILAEQELTRDDFKDAEKDYAVHGDTRRVFVQPSDVQHRFFQYDDYTLPLALTDLDILQGKSEPENLENGKFLALSLSFSLPPGCYATMAIRELCRMDTGKQYQSTLNDYTVEDEQASE